MFYYPFAGRPVVLQHVLNQVNTPTRRIQFVAEQCVCRAGRCTKTAVNTGPQNFLGLSGRRIGKLGEGKVRFHAGDVVLVPATSAEAVVESAGPLQFLHAHLPAVPGKLLA